MEFDSAGFSPLPRYSVSARPFDAPQESRHPPSSLHGESRVSRVDLEREQDIITLRNEQPHDLAPRTHATVHAVAIGYDMRVLESPSRG